MKLVQKIVKIKKCIITYDDLRKRTLHLILIKSKL